MLDKVRMRYSYQNPKDTVNNYNYVSDYPLIRDILSANVSAMKAEIDPLNLLSDRTNICFVQQTSSYAARFQSYLRTATGQP